MEFQDKRKVDAEGNARVAEPEEKFDDFQPTLAGFKPVNGSVLLRELKLPEESMIATPDAYAEPCLFAEIIAGSAPPHVKIFANQTARILKGIGHTIEFKDAEPGQRYFTVNYQDIIGVWSR